MAVSTSASGKSAAKKAAKTRKSRTMANTVAKKAAVTRKQRVAGKKAATTRKRRVAAKKAVATRKTNAAARAASGVNTSEIDARIAMARNNLRDLVEQAASYSGAADEERMSQRIADQEAKIDRLKKQRGAL